MQWQRPQTGVTDEHWSTGCPPHRVRLDHCKHQVWKHIILNQTVAKLQRLRAEDIFFVSFTSRFCYWLSSLSHYKQQWQWWYVIYYPYHYGSHLHTYIIDSYLHSYYVHQAFISTPYQRCTRYISVSYLLHTNVVGTSSNHIYTLPT